MRDRNEELWRRLRAELDRVEPRWSSPRYLTSTNRPVLRRFAPAVLAFAVGGILALTAFAGSPNPVVWTQHVVTVVHPQTPSPTPTPVRNVPASSPTQEPPEQHESPEPSQPPEQHESPEPSGGDSGSGSGDHDTSD